MKTSTLFIAATLSLAALSGSAHAAAVTYDITSVFHEPDTQPNNSLFIGQFDYDSVTHTVSNLAGRLSESMTGSNAVYPNDTMTWLNLSHQLVSWYDASLGGTFAAAFKNSSTATFWTGADGQGDGWSPGAGVAVGGVYSGFPIKASNPGNAYVLIFVPDDPLTALTQAQLDKIAYADCAPGGMMGAVCMTGTSLAGYGSIGTMSGVPLSQTITTAVPEAGSGLMALLGLGLIGWLRHRRHTAA